MPEKKYEHGDRIEVNWHGDVWEQGTVVAIQRVMVAAGAPEPDPYWTLTFRLDSGRAGTFYLTRDNSDNPAIRKTGSE